VSDKSRMPNSSSRNWWQSEDVDLGECPITLESLSTLPYPPFALSTSDSGNGVDASAISQRRPAPATMAASASTIPDDYMHLHQHHHQVSYFDGLALATYMVSRGIFQNPLTRQDLTMQDCRRLDEYLVEYCYRGSSGDDGSQNGPRFGNTHRKHNFSVAEAFALRNTVRVGMSTAATGGNGNNDGGDGTVQRMNALRSAATAALAGLFVYSNRQGRRGEDGTTSNDATQGDLANPLTLDWGFDLTRTVENTAEFDGGEGGYGWTVIDDDEAAVVATRHHAYQSVQEAFPPLPNSAGVEGSTTTTSGTGRSASRHGGTSAATVVVPDEHLIERVRTLAIQDREAQMQRARQAEHSRQLLLQEALARREMRRKLRAAELARGVEVYQNHRMEEEEVQQARAEIEAWREDQWERLRLLSERQIQLQKEQDTNAKVPKAAEKAGEESTSKADYKSDMDVSRKPIGATSAEVEEAKRKEKAAAKRKRAKERKKAQRDEEMTNMERIKRMEAELARKAASILKCAVCGQGILDCGFQKFNQTLCSPKCARAAKPNYAP
jgi:hypothetical protein